MFDKHFEVFLADTYESKKIHYSIRYQVYCDEMGFENKDDFPMEQEFDEYDNSSVHFIVRHKQTGQWIGAMRLIFQANQPLPIEQYCNLHEPIDKSGPQRSVELSRLCVVKEIRRRFSDIDPPHGISDESKEVQETDKVKLLSNHRISRSVIWGLINAATEYCYSRNISNWYFMTTNGLARVLRRGGCNMMDIGDPCYHRGERYPFKKDVVDTYLNEAWRDEYKHGYRLFSQSAVSRYQKNAAA